MILYEEDWDRYPTAIIDYETKNKSFLRLAALYKSMGVKNNAFILALINPDLQGVDPFDYANLSVEQMAMIVIECKQNPWYFFREIAVVPGGNFDDRIQLKANRGNIALYWLFFNHITTTLVQIRQTGKSLSMDELDTYLMNIACTNTQINLLTKDDTLRSANLERLKNIEAELPYYLKQRTKNDIGNTEELQIKKLKNSYKAHLPNKSPKMAYLVGRGLTSPIFKFDEAAFLYNIEISMPAALASGTAARVLAKEKGTPHGIIVATTAGKKDEKEGRYIYTMIQESATWTELFLDAKNEEDLNKLVRTNSPKGLLQVNCTFNHRQLGYSDEWLRNAIETAKAVGEDADRDFFNVWTSGKQLSPLSTAILEMIKKSEMLDYYNEIAAPYAYITRWYIPEEIISYKMKQGHYIMGLDTSEAAGDDDIFMSLRSVLTGEIIAAATVNETNLIMFCEWLCNWFIKYENFTLIIERRSTGAMILDYLLIMLPSKGIDPFKRIYNKVVQDAEEFPDRLKEISKSSYLRSMDVYTKYKKLFGFATSGTGVTSRSDLYSNTLHNAAKITGDKVRDPFIINQILGLVVRNGRVDHDVGEHDDGCISWLLSAWLLFQGKNLHFYGINSRDILSENITHREINNPKSNFDRREQAELHTAIENLVEEIRQEKDEFVTYKLEIKLKLLANRLTETDKATLSVDELINNLRLTKNRKKPIQRYY